MCTYNAIVANLMINLPVFHHIYTVIWIWRGLNLGERGERGGTTQFSPPQHWKGRVHYLQGSTLCPKFKTECSPEFLVGQMRVQSWEQEVYDHLHTLLIDEGKHIPAAGLQHTYTVSLDSSQYILAAGFYKIMYMVSLDPPQLYLQQDYRTHTRYP